MAKDYTNNWNLLFKIGNLGDLDKPLSAKVLSNSEHKVTKHILYLYSMESFIYGDLNKACRMKSKTEIRYYGAFAAALSYIIFAANNKRKDKM